MKSNEGSFAAALLLAVVTGSAGASEAGVGVFGCHTTSPAPAVPGTTIPGHTIEEGELFCVNRNSPNRICSPKIEVPPTTIDGASGGGSSDVYCSRLSSAGSSVTSVTNAVCPAGQQGVVVSRSGASSLIIEFTKNGVPQLPFPITAAPGQAGEPQDLCVLTDPSKLID